MKVLFKRILYFILFTSAILSIDITTSEASTIFKDINSSHPAFKEITYLAQGKITTGDANGNFNPTSNVTRAEAAALLGRALLLDGTKRNTSFKDVNSTNFASGYIQSAVDKKIISGYKDGSFKPYGFVTRGEMAIMINRAFGYSFGNTASSAVQTLFVKGIANDVIGIHNGASRADTALYLARAINYNLRTNSNISFNKEMYVNSNSLNLRQGPSTTYNIIGTLKNQEIVTIGYSVGGWTLVKSSNNHIGFVANSYLTSGDSSSSEENPEGNEDNNANQNPISSQTLIIDPGHGGKDPGAVGFGLKEKDVVLDTSFRLRDLLAKTPINVKLTRETDIYIDPKERAPLAKKLNGDVFVSIHSNSFNGSANGSETYYYGKSSNPNVSDSKLLAEFIQKRLIKAMETKDRGFKHGNYQVLRENTMTAVLVELAFISNESDNKKLASPIYRQKGAEAIYLGILDYYNSKGYDVTNLYEIVNK